MTVIVPDFQQVLSNEFAPQAGLRPHPWYWEPSVDAAACWQQWAQQTADWLTSHKISPRDTLVIVPVGAVLAHARQAWAQVVGGWAPTIETVASLIAAHSWRQPAANSKNRVTGDAVADRLRVSRLLLKESWSKQWAARDPKGFEYATQQLVSAAHGWVKRAQAIAPDRRASYWQRARSILSAQASSPVQFGSREKLLLAWALEWVIESFEAGWASDVLFDLPYRCIVGISAGSHVASGTEASVMLSLMADAAEKRGVVCRWDVAQATDRALAPTDFPALVACLDGEDEARHAAAAVLEAVGTSRQQGGDAVALIALDRGLIRRIRAMLEGAGAQIADETGWVLSTTRASAVVTRLLAAASPQASSDDLLDWLKSGWTQLPTLSACDELEAWFRHHNWLRAWDKPSLLKAGKPCPPDALQLWEEAQSALKSLADLFGTKRRPLRAWVTALGSALQAAGAWSALGEDDAGALLLRSLHLVDADDSGDEWNALLDEMLVDSHGFSRWVREMMENTTFRPPSPTGRIDVVITPLARAVMRPFHSIIMPGADAKQLGHASSDTSWLGASARRDMCLATPEDLRQAQWDAFELLMTRPAVTCLFRQGQGSEPMESSPWLQRWAQDRGGSWTDRTIDWNTSEVPFKPADRPTPELRPSDLSLLPEYLSATSYEALRQCPYRFFAQSILKLRDVDELEEGLDRSDYGIWLHEVIRRFHVEREQMLAMRTPQEDVEAWLRIAEVVMVDLGLNNEATRPYFQPYRAVMSSMAQVYVRWLHQHEKEGWRCVDNEAVASLDLLGDETTQGVRLKGQIDRIDARYEEQDRRRMVIDYKTGSLQSLREKVKRPLEDTQLPFYAAMVGPDVGRAAYLHLDGKSATLVSHEDVQDHAEVLMEGIRHDLSRIMQGAAMPALGDAAACTYCSARGLCRKDHWPPEAQGSEGAV